MIASAETAVVKRTDVNKAVAIFMVKTHFKLEILNTTLSQGFVSNMKLVLSKAQFNIYLAYIILARKILMVKNYL
ncbi:hypothetical protein AS4_14700 [Acinetobacter guillouiae]|nr:hypothetical protein AS4_14700 [Acinetobacter guillouiae]